MNKEPDRISDLRAAHRKSAVNVYSGFMSPAEQSAAVNALKGETYCFFGGFPDAERKMLCIGCDTPDETDFPISCLKITITDKTASPSHSDYMGALMALGIERDVMGDIADDGNTAHVFIQSDFVNYFTINLTSVSRYSCSVALYDGTSVTLTPKLLEMSVNVASDRLDCFVSVLSRLSREKSCALIKAGKVTVNGIEAESASKHILQGDTVVIRGEGKFIVAAQDGKTRSDRLRYKIKKYI